MPSIRSSPDSTGFASRFTPPDRRRSERDSLQGEPSRTRLIALILGTYAEMPGLCLDERQAVRLFGLREITCRVVLEDLVRDGRLTRGAGGRYRKP